MLNFIDIVTSNKKSLDQSSTIKKSSREYLILSSSNLSRLSIQSRLSVICVPDVRQTIGVIYEFVVAHDLLHCMSLVLCRGEVNIPESPETLRYLYVVVLCKLRPTNSRWRRFDGSFFLWGRKAVSQFCHKVRWKVAPSWVVLMFLNIVYWTNSKN
jgi:hypothetical protein